MSVTEGAAPQKAVRQKKKYKSYTWRQSRVIKASLLCMVVILVAAGFSITMSIKSLDSIVKVSYQDKTKDSLRRHLDTLKDSYALWQALVLHTVADEMKGLGEEGLDADVLRITKAIESMESERYISLPSELPFEIRPISSSDGRQAEEFAWLTRNKLKAGNLVVIFDHSKVIENFDAIQSAYQDFSSASFHLKNNIGPQLIFYNVMLLFAVFLSIGIILFLLANYISRNIDAILNGLSYWVSDSSFRFGRTFSGEFRSLTLRINKILDEVEENRRKNLYLEKVASWQTIARKLAHEVKNPLTPIQIMVSHLQRSFAKGDPQFPKHLEKACTIIPEEISALKRLVNNFSDFAKLPQPKFDKLEIVQPLNNIVELQKAEFPQHSMSVTSHSGKIFINGDADLLKQVFKNIIKNACQACGERPCAIEIDAWIEDEKVHITFKDNGPGIPEDTIGKIFEAYFSTKDSGPNQGMGLGLAICRKIILDHEGAISVVSRQETIANEIRGETIFEIVLPVYPD